MDKSAYAVFEGGGVKAFGILGALYEAEQMGYTWVNVAGTSAGAIIAALIAAGYSAREIKQEIYDLDLTLFKDKDWIDRIPYVGLALSLWFESGLYEGDYLEKWVRDLLAKKGVNTFGDLVLKEYENHPKYRYRLVIIATDVTRRKLLKLPYDLTDYNIKPDSFEVCKAVRMSASLPFFYEPYKIRYKDRSGKMQLSFIIDGGVLSNFPVWIFDSEDMPSRPTFGFKIVEPEETRPLVINNPFELFKAMICTMLEAHDKLHEMNPKSSVRTISIPSLGIKTTDFDNVGKWRDSLFRSGVDAAQNFFNSWNFENFITQFCSQKC